MNEYVYNIFKDLVRLVQIAHMGLHGALGPLRVHLVFPPIWSGHY